LILSGLSHILPQPSLTMPQNILIFSPHRSQAGVQS